MTQQDDASAPRPQDVPSTGDVTQGGGQQPTVEPEQDDPDREGEDRFDAG